MNGRIGNVQRPHSAQNKEATTRFPVPHSPEEENHFSSHHRESSGFNAQKTKIRWPCVFRERESFVETNQKFDQKHFDVLVVLVHQRLPVFRNIVSAMRSLQLRSVQLANLLDALRMGFVNRSADRKASS